MVCFEGSAGDFGTFETKTGALALFKSATSTQGQNFKLREERKGDFYDTSNQTLTLASNSLRISMNLIDGLENGVQVRPNGNTRSSFNFSFVFFHLFDWIFNWCRPAYKP